MMGRRARASYISAEREPSGSRRTCSPAFLGGKTKVKRALEEIETATRQMHVLVVEDELFIRMFVSDALRDEGYTVIEAINADEALDIIMAGKRIDIVFSDVRMPGNIDGLGLLNTLKNLSPALPVILASGHLGYKEASAEGANHIISKPYQIETVLTLVANELAKSE